MDTSDDSRPGPGAEERTRVVAALQVGPGTSADLARRPSTWSPPTGVEATECVLPADDTLVMQALTEDE